MNMHSTVGGVAPAALHGSETALGSPTGSSSSSLRIEAGGRPPKRSAVLASRVAAACWLLLHTLVIAVCFGSGGCLMLAWEQQRHALGISYIVLSLATAALYYRLFGSEPGYLDNVGHGQVGIQPVLARHCRAIARFGSSLVSDNICRLCILRIVCFRCFCCSGGEEEAKVHHSRRHGAGAWIFCRPKRRL